MESEKFNRRIRVFEILISIAMPLVVGVSGYIIQLRISENQSFFSLRHEISTKLLDRRLVVYDQIKHPLNDIYCYIEEVGDWDKLSAPHIRQLRHEINNIMYVNRSIWSPETFALYSMYIDNVAFELSSDHSISRIRAEANSARKRHENAMVLENQLTGNRAHNHKELYQQLNDAFSYDLFLR